MYLDAKNMFSDKQKVTSSIASTTSNESGKFTLIDMNAVAAFGVAKLPFLVQVGESFKKTTGTPTLIVTLQLGEELDSSGSFIKTSEFKLTEALEFDDLTAGTYLYKGTIPEHVKWRYARLYYTVSGTFTEGFINAGILQESGY